jgi:tetratricopeptide (TPR) repeat protein
MSSSEQVSQSARAEGASAVAQVGGDNTGIISTGDAHNEQHFHLPPSITPMEHVAAPPNLANLAEPSSLFVGREDDLRRIHSALSADGPLRVVAVHGLGGVGKSTLAAHYARRHRDEYRVIWRVPGDGPTEIAAGLADLATALQPQLANLPREALPGQALRWLSTHDDWLLLVDNVERPADLALLGDLPAGRVLVTSRRATGWPGIATVPLDVLDHDEAVTLLTRTATEGRHGTPLPGADDLCRELGRLPLAIRQAGAYLAETMATPDEYLADLARHPALVYREAAVDWVWPTMARVWRVTLDRLVEDRVTVNVLRVLAWLAPDDAPRDLLFRLGDEFAVRRAIGRLHALSMVTATSTAVSVHRLVQAVTRTPDAGDPHRQPVQIAAAREDATRVLLEAVEHSDPRAPDAVPVFAPLVPHIDALASHTATDDDTTATAMLLNHTGMFLAGHGTPDTPDRYIRRALSACEQTLGPDHEDTLTCRSNLAFLHHAAGDHELAATVYAEVLRDRERVLGPDHRDTLNARSDLAATYEAMGDLDRAIPQLEAVLADCVRVLGEDDVDTIGSRNAVAYAHESAGNLPRATALYEQVVADCTRLLGPDHHFTLLSRNNLACSHVAAKRWDQAVPALEALVADRERVLGEDHPDTAVSRINLAVAAGSSGDWDRAVPLHETVLAQRLRVLGPDHPATAAAETALQTALTRRAEAAR